MRLQRRKVGNFCIHVVKLAPILHNNHSTCWNTFVPTWRHGTQTITPCDSFTTLPAIIPPTNQASQVHKYKYKTAADWSSNNRQPCQVQTWTPDVTNPKAKQHIQSNLETPQILYRNQREAPTKDRRNSSHRWKIYLSDSRMSFKSCLIKLCWKIKSKSYSKLNWLKWNILVLYLSKFR